MNTNKVSVILPVYNGIATIEKAVTSVLNQSYKELELIVVDNHSVDGTYEYLHSIDDTRLTLYQIHNNGCIARSRNLGIYKSEGQYLAFIDADDWWESSKLELCINELKDADAVCHSELWINENTNYSRLVNYGPESRASYHSLLYKGNVISTSAVVTKRNCVVDAGCFNESQDLVTVEDYDLWLKMTRNGVNFKFINSVLGFYRIHSSNSSSAPLRNMHSLLNLLEVHSVCDFNLTSYKKRIAYIYYDGARNLYKSGLNNLALKYFVIAIRKDPFIPKFYLGMMLSLFSIIGIKIERF